MRIENQRLEYIDIAKAIGIFLVIMGHEFSDSVNIYRRVIYSFHMPLFFFLSGLVFNQNRQDSFFCALKKRFYGIYIPYIIWACFYSQSGSLKNLGYILYGTRETLTLAGSTAPLWYLEALFVADIFVILFWRCARKLPDKYHEFLCLVGCIAFGGIGVMMPHPADMGNLFAVDNAFVAAAFILMGTLFKKFFHIMSGLKGKQLGIICILLTALFSVGEYLWQRSEGATLVVMSRADYGNLMSFTFLSVTGIFLTLIFSILLSNMPCRKKFLLYAGQNTLGILVVHNKIIRYFARLAGAHGLDNNSLAVAILLSAICIMVSMVLVFGIRKIFPELVGGRKIENEK